MVIARKTTTGLFFKEINNIFHVVESSQNIQRSIKNMGATSQEQQNNIYFPVSDNVIKVLPLPTVK